RAAAVAEPQPVDQQGLAHPSAVAGHGRIVPRAGPASRSTRAHEEGPLRVRDASIAGTMFGMADAEQLANPIPPWAATSRLPCRARAARRAPASRPESPQTPAAAPGGAWS